MDDMLELLVDAVPMFPPSFWTGCGIAAPIIAGGVKWASTVNSRQAVVESRISEVERSQDAMAKDIKDVLAIAHRVEGVLSKDHS